jgi:hemerythrin-like metal-binding protein
MPDCSSCHESARPRNTAIDREHDIIVKAMAGLHNAVLEGRGPEVIVPLLELLARFCAEHFANEEAVMRDCEYPGVNAHAAAHEDMLRTLMELQRRSREDALPTIVDTMDLLGRLSVHTDRYDREAERCIQAAASQRDAQWREERLAGHPQAR